MEAKLVVVGGEAKTGEVKLKLPSVIGRGRDADVRITHPLVSRRHCEISESGGMLYVRDLGSLNGTFISDARITEAALKPDELITIGPVIFRAVYESHPTAPAADQSTSPAKASRQKPTAEQPATSPAATVTAKKTVSVRETVPAKTERSADDDALDIDWSDDQPEIAAASPAMTEANPTAPRQADDDRKKTSAQPVKSEPVQAESFKIAAAQSDAAPPSGATLPTAAKGDADNGHASGTDDAELDDFLKGLGLD